MTEQAATGHTESTTSPVVTQEKETVNAPPAQDLDALLSEFESSVKAKTEVKTETKVESKPDETSTIRNELAQLQYERDIGPAVDLVRGDLDKDTFDQKFVENWMEARAKENPRIMEAWLNRRANPDGFKKVMSGLGSKFRDQFGRLKRETDSDLVAAAVKGAARSTSTQEPAPDFSSMSDSAFMAHKSQLLRQARKKT